jgi:translation initiation factor IF-3
MKNQKKKPEPSVRINYQIRISPVRVIRDDEQLGIIPTKKALQLAQNAGLDLVEVAPQARPPVCKIMDFGKYKYEQSVRDKNRKQSAKKNELKELRLGCKIAEHDIETKTNAARKFLSQGKTVQLNLFYKNRELAHKDEGFRVIEKMIEDLKEVGKVALKPKLQGHKLSCRLEPI